MSPQNTAISARHRPSFRLADPDSPLGRIFATFSRLCQGIATYRRVRADIFELQSQSDATLRDIGISRSEIVSLVHREHYGLVDKRYARF